MYVGLISDTHGVFADDVKQFLEPVDVIWHAGDFGGIACADAIAAFKPLIGVYGNCDGADIRAVYPWQQVFMAEDVKVAMMHIGGFPGRYDWEAYNLITHRKPGIFVCGHSHILRVMRDQKMDTMVLNPGSCGFQGIHVVRTALRFRIDGPDIHDMEVGEWKRSESCS
ncbi:MAG: metallophosphoesterase family protein [Bacteroidales bacterium]|nr:metallophosphoesterase family protein [Bacteroidales bacterium]